MHKPVHQEIQVIQDSQEQMDLPDEWDHQVIQDSQDQKEGKDHEDHQDEWDQEEKALEAPLSLVDNLRTVRTLASTLA